MILIEDITARKKAEEELMKYQHQLEEMVREKSRELAESEERYRRIVESPLIAFWEADASGVFTFVNKRLVEMAGYESEDEIVGKLTMLQCIVPEKREWLAERMQRHRNGKLEADIVETELLKKDGSRFPVIVSPAPVFNEEGELVKIVGGMIDITRRKEMEERLRTLVRQLRHVNEDLEAFASSVSHDLRAPLRALQGFGNALLEDYARALDEIGREYLTRIVNAAASMDCIIQDLLAYSRLSMRDISLTPVDMNTVVEEALELLDDDIREREAEVMVSSLPRVKGHHSTLVQVMSNLLSNAIKFVEEGNGFVRIYVRDNGIGIEREYHEKIFKPFERLHGRERYPGTGIGLAIVKKGVEKWAEALVLKVSPAREAPSGYHWRYAMRNNTNFKKHTILLVEDDRNDIMLIQRAFTKAGIANPLMVVGDGTDAIAYLRGEGAYADRTRYPIPILVLLDLKLPKKNGFEVLEWMKNDAELRKIPVVVLTSSSEHPDINRAYALGANSYLVKPVSFDALHEMVKTLHLYWLVMNAHPDVEVVA